MQQFSSFLVTNWPLFLALVIILFLLVRSYVGPGAVKAVGPMQALQLINHEDALVLDVRTDKEFNEGHIINSMHVPLGVLSNSLNQLAPYKASTIVVVCRSGARSGQAVSQLRKAGFENVYNLAGGVMAWQSANMPLTTEKGKPPKPGRRKAESKPADVGADKDEAAEGDKRALIQEVGEADATAKAESAPAEGYEGEAAMTDSQDQPREIVIYTGRFCPYCARALQLLKSKGVAYTELSVDGDPELRREMTEKAGASSVPQIFVDGRHIGDCDGIHALDAQGKLDELLGIKGS